jgi:hypothetical protein
MALQLISGQRKFASTVNMLMDVFQGFSEAQRAFNESLDARDDWYGTMHHSQQMQKELVEKSWSRSRRFRQPPSKPNSWSTKTTNGWTN